MPCSEAAADLSENIPKMTCNHPTAFQPEGSSHPCPSRGSRVSFSMGTPELSPSWLDSPQTKQSLGERLLGMGEETGGKRRPKYHEKLLQYVILALSHPPKKGKKGVNLRERLG